MFTLQRSIDTGTSWQEIHSTIKPVTADGALNVVTFPYETTDITHMFRVVGCNLTTGNVTFAPETVLATSFTLLEVDVIIPSFVLGIRRD